MAAHLKEMDKLVVVLQHAIHKMILTGVLVALETSLMIMMTKTPVTLQLLTHQAFLNYTLMHALLLFHLRILDIV